MSADPQPKSVLETILDWSVSRPDWQRDGLRRIVQKGKLDAAELKEVLGICKGTSPFPSVAFDKTHLPAKPDELNSICLHSVSDVKFVNRLAKNITLDFIPNGLTIIYGDNGAGKSGYARILKKACRARHAGDIHANIYDPLVTGTKASASITYGVIGERPVAEAWQDGNGVHPVLSAVSVFDTNCAAIHLNNPNEVAFRPFGLDIPEELAEACRQIKDLLQLDHDILARSQNPIFSAPTGKPMTAVGKLISELNAKSPLAPFEILADLSDPERKRLDVLKDDLAKDPEKASREQNLKAEKLTRLLEYVNMVNDGISDVQLGNISTLKNQSSERNEAARLAADAAFNGEKLDNVGGQVWKLLWEAARKYSVEEAYPEKKFPVTEDAVCVLCQQPLEEIASDRLSRFEKFVQSDVKLQAQRSSSAFAEELVKINNIPLFGFSRKSELEELFIQDPSLYKRVLRFLTISRVKRNLFNQFLNDGITKYNILNDDVCCLELQTLIKHMQTYAALLLASSNPAEREKLELEYAELADRETLNGLLNTIDDEITRLVGMAFLSEKISETNTRHITTMGNTIADSVITPKLQIRFQEEITKLGGEKINVEMVRSGGSFGTPLYRVKLANSDAQVKNILSEGEQTCVSFSAFLAELATAGHFSTLVFDDPVTSLDHKWRKKVAVRLAEEAKSRQIIVFTHDLVFVNDLADNIEESKLYIRTVTKSSKGTGNVSPGLPWAGKSVADRIDTLEKALTQAKKHYDNEEEEEYKDKCIKIYNQLRATWERAIEDIAFSRVVLRFRDYINTKDLMKASLLTEEDCSKIKAGFKKCCDITEAHDPSSARNDAVPTPTDLKQDIGDLKEWADDLIKRQAAFKKTN